MIWRIRERSAFERLAREGRRIRVTCRTDTLPDRTGGSSGRSDRPTVWCTHLPDHGAVPPRVAYAFGRAHGTAVRRNRLRRRVRALLSEHAGDGRLPPGWYLVGGSTTLGELTFAQLREAIDELVDRVARMAHAPSSPAPLPPQPVAPS